MSSLSKALASGKHFSKVLFSVTLHSNILGTDFGDFVSGLGKPESYVSVCVNDGCDMIWGGENTPCALGNLYSLGAINLENNKKVMADITKLLREFDVPVSLSLSLSLSLTHTHTHTHTLSLSLSLCACVYVRRVVRVCTQHAHTHTQANRMYVNFFDVPAQNCGYNGATFGG